MTRNIQLEKALDQAMIRVKAENKDMLPDFFNPHRTAVVWEPEKLISSIEASIGSMRDDEAFREAYDDLRKVCPEFMGKTGPSVSSF